MTLLRPRGGGGEWRNGDEPNGDADDKVDDDTDDDDDSDDNDGEEGREGDEDDRKNVPLPLKSP